MSQSEDVVKQKPKLPPMIVMNLNFRPVVKVEMSDLYNTEKRNIGKEASGSFVPLVPVPEELAQITIGPQPEILGKSIEKYTAILNVTDFDYFFEQPRLPLSMVIKRNNIHYKFISTKDNGDFNIKETIDEGIAFIAKELETPNARILVHCMAGISRSVTVVAAHLILNKGMTYDKAMAAIRIIRPQAQPNFEFDCTLEHLSFDKYGVRSVGF